MKKSNYFEYILTIHFKNGQKKSYTHKIDTLTFYKDKWQSGIVFLTSPKQLGCSKNVEEFYQKMDASIWQIERKLPSIAHVKAISIKAIYYNTSSSFERLYNYDMEEGTYVFFEQGKKDPQICFEEFQFSDYDTLQIIKEEPVILATNTKKCQDYLYAGNVQNLNFGKTLIIPDGVKYIEKDTFLSFSTFTHLTLPASIEYIDPSAFSRCYALEKIELKDNSRYTVIDNRLWDNLEGQYLTYGTQGNASLFISTKEEVDWKEIEPFPESFALPDFSDFGNNQDICIDNWKSQFVRNSTRIHACELLEEIWKRIGKKECAVFMIVRDINDSSRIFYLYWDGKEKVIGTKENWIETPLIQIREWMTSIGVSYSKKRAMTLSAFPSLLFDFSRKGKQKKKRETYTLCYESGKYRNHMCIDSITSSAPLLEKEAFKNCFSLKRVVLDNTVEIAEEAFSNCISLEEVELPASLQKIGTHSFKNCTSLKRVMIQPGCLSLGKGCFQGCDKLESIILPSSIREIEEEAFLGCKALKQVILPSIEVIQSACFKDCWKLEKVVLPTSLKKISSQAFLGCKSLETLEGAASCECKEIVQGAFKDTKFYEETRLSKNEIEFYIGKYLWYSNKRNLIIKDGTIGLDRYSINGIESLWIPKSLHTLQVSICQKQANLKKVVFEEGVYAILKDEYGAFFSDCPRLETVLWPASLVLVHPDSFSNCTNLTIYGKTGSYAEAFANRRLIHFKGE
ncbi:MAG: leucine-rich repeat protein [Bacillota bacterium]|nr:leucine-rich repeat protein [Bacillota bacterium]